MRTSRAYRNEAPASLPYQFLCQCIELISNLDPQTTIDMRYRSPDAFVGWVVSLNDSLGRRARDLILADAIDDWEPVGIYEIARVSKNRLRVTHKQKGLVTTIACEAKGE